MTPAARLAKALQEFNNIQLGDLARKIDVPADKVRRAANGARGQLTSARTYLRLCMELKIDPVTGDTCDHSLAEIDPPSFAVALRMKRFFYMQTIREAAKAMQVSACCVSRMENGDIRSFVVFLAGCRYLQRHPYEFLAASRETSTGKSLIAQDEVRAE